MSCQEEDGDQFERSTREINYTPNFDAIFSRDRGRPNDGGGEMDRTGQLCSTQSPQPAQVESSLSDGRRPSNFVPPLPQVHQQPQQYNNSYYAHDGQRNSAPHQQVSVQNQQPPSIQAPRTPSGHQICYNQSFQVDTQLQQQPLVTQRPSIPQTVTQYQPYQQTNIAPNIPANLNTNVNTQERGTYQLDELPRPLSSSNQPTPQTQQPIHYAYTNSNFINQEYRLPILPYLAPQQCILLRGPLQQQQHMPQTISPRPPPSVQPQEQQNQTRQRLPTQTIQMQPHPQQIVQPPQQPQALINTNSHISQSNTSSYLQQHVPISSPNLSTLLGPSINQSDCQQPQYSTNRSDFSYNNFTTNYQDVASRGTARKNGPRTYTRRQDPNMPNRPRFQTIVTLNDTSPNCNRGRMGRRPTILRDPPILTQSTTDSNQQSVAVSSTTRQPGTTQSQSIGTQVEIEVSNKACQFDARFMNMISRSLNATVEMLDGTSQTDDPESGGLRTYVDRASSPVGFPPLHVPVRKKITPKRPRTEYTQPTTKATSGSDTEINVIE